jgi:hypothetical protein
MATKEQNKANAARMKAEGVKRMIALCPVCYKKVALNNIYHHIVTCK